MSEGGNDVNYYMEGCNPNEVGQLELAEGEPRYSLGELLALYAEYETEHPVEHKVVCMDNSHPEEAIAALSEVALKQNALTFLKWLAARDIGPKLRPTVRLGAA